MRATLASVIAGLLGGILVLAACGNSERAGAEEAQRQAEAEQKAKAQATAPAQRMSTPVRGEAHVPCTQLIDPAAFQAALKEKQPLTVQDVTKSERDATASCALVRGGKRPTEAEQQAMIKHSGRLGVLPGDVVCNVTAICSKIMDAEQFKASCKQRKDHDDESLGSYACVQIVPVGADDVKVFRLLDEDTRCILEVRGGPSNVDNELIRACAKAARDTIGPAQIQVEAAAGSAG
ncbi:MAG TPA: hypothetical protein VF469_34135 [Kofleriaceae bacterium]